MKRYNNSSKDDFSKFTGTSVQVRGDDVNGALRRLKKILEADDRQRELSKREFYEKPSIRNKRVRDMAKRRHQKDVLRNFVSGETPATKVTGTHWMKSKRKRRKVLDRENIMASLQRKRNSERS